MSNLRRILLVIVAVVIVVFAAIQFVPVPARANPAVNSQIQWNSAETEQLTRTACYDCHSNETVWPWYAYLAPLSWKLADDVQKGREALNFSEQNASEISPEELIDEVEEGAMPPASYLVLHPSVKLTEAQKEQLVTGFTASLHGTERDGEARESQEGESRESEENEQEENEAAE